MCFELSLRLVEQQSVLIKERPIFINQIKRRRNYIILRFHGAMKNFPPL